MSVMTQTSGLISSDSIRWNPSSIRYKINRLKRGESPRVLDLFAGCGGLSLGFNAAGFKIAGAVEFDPKAARSHGRNFHKDDNEEIRERHSSQKDITAIAPEELATSLKLGRKVSSGIDLIIGGPPCQAYSIVGRAKLRETAQDPQAFKNDERAELYLYFLKYVEAFQPLVVLMENVPEILRYGNKNVAEEIACKLESMGYRVRYTILNSVYYGVPQLRDRMFILAYRQELNTDPAFPEPTHCYPLPRGYQNLRRDVSKKLGVDSLFPPSKYFVRPPENDETGIPAITAGEALGDLPEIRALDLLLAGKIKRGPRRFTVLTPYDKTTKPDTYAQFMRSWPGFESNGGIYDHAIRYLPRDYAIFKEMAANSEYPQAHRVAVQIFERKLAKARKKGRKIEPDSEEYNQLKKATVPPYDPGKFANKWRKLDGNEPSRTLTAHIGKDTYSHIHYDSDQSRTISVREAARLQSFPDGFVFEGTLDPALKQIGNAVPPLLAKALAEEIKTIIQ